MKAGQRIFTAGNAISQIAMIIKGSVRITDEHITMKADAGEIICGADIYDEVYKADYVSDTDCVLFMLPISNEATLESFLDSNADYRGVFVYSMGCCFTRYMEQRRKLMIMLEESRGHIRDHYAYLKRLGKTYKKTPEITDDAVEDVYGLSQEPEDAEFYAEGCNVSVKAFQEFYKQSTYMALYQMEKLKSHLSDMRDDAQNLCTHISEIFGYLFVADGDDSLLVREKQLLESQYESGKVDQGLISRLNDTKDEVVTIYSVLDKVGLAPTDADPRVISESIKEIITSASKVNVDGSEELDDDVSEESLTEQLMNSAQSILYFSGISKEEAEQFTGYLKEFEESTDRQSISDEMRRLKKQITAMYFDIYEKCLIKWISDKDVPLPVKLFLYFGFFDEKLLSFDQLKALIVVSRKLGDGPEDGVYYMPEWLEAVYNGEKEPSRNTFEQDYPDYLREQKKRGEITEAEEEQLKYDYDAMLHFEVMNMFQQVNKVSNGQIMNYVPILYQEEIFGVLTKIFTGRKSIREQLLKIEEVNISAFARETSFHDDSLGITRETVIERIYPDIIITPVYGMSATMWQECGGKRRATPGRIIFPVFEESDAEKLMVQMVGRLTWEYTRREMGVDWNNIAIKSLTSEYSDYLQYYRKNRELNEELRDKIKIQLQKARNNFRDAFVMDYVNWMQYEANGAMKLNRVAREIMATYCPFTKERRDSLRANAMFEKAMFRQERNFNELAHGWELKIRKRENHDEEVPQEFYDTYEYYTKN